MPHIGLHLWLTYGDESPVLARIRNAVISVMTTDQEGCRRFFREAGITGAASETAVSSLKRELAHSRNANEFVHLTPVLLTLTNCHDLLPFYEPYSLMAEVSSVLDRFRNGTGTREEKINAYNLVSTYLE